MIQNKISVLYIEDDKADVDFLESAIREVGCAQLDLQVIRDGAAAIKFIEADPPTDRSFPHLILLDLNLPKVNGKDVLRILKASKHYKPVPVLVLTTSAAQADVEHAYGLGASGFITKPLDYDEYKATAKRVCEYWLKSCAIPGGHGNDAARESATILCIEDNKDEIKFIKSAIEATNRDVELKVQAVHSGEEALRLLEELEIDSSRVLPSLVILDLNLPKISGRLLMQFLRRAPRLKRVPLIVLSGSSFPGDREDSERLGAELHFQKPDDFDGYKTIFWKIQTFLAGQKPVAPPRVSPRATHPNQTS